MNTGVLGERHGLLTLVAHTPTRTSDGRVAGVWECDCGERKVIAIGRVRCGQLRSCGHLAREAKPALKHGMRGTKEYRAWCGAKQRCTNKSAKDYPRYGGSGIVFHSEWIDDFQTFLDHIGPCPTPDHQLDRIDTTRGYEPGNVRWATRQTQARNRLVSYTWTIKGLQFESAKEAADHFGVSIQTVWRWTREHRDERRNATIPKREDCNAIPRY